MAGRHHFNRWLGGGDQRMAWTIACMCGELWHGEPPDACPICGRTISAGIKPLGFQPVEQIGYTTTSDVEHETW